MSCFQSTTANAEENCADLYESVEDISDFFALQKNRESDVFFYSVVDFKNIITSIPRDIFNIFTFTINVYTSEEKTLTSCEFCYIRTNIKIKPYFPLNSSITFQGVVNGLCLKSTNQTIIPLNEEILYIRIQNLNSVTQTIPKHMSVGKIVVTAKEHWDL
jgi:hypothetical protein